MKRLVRPITGDEVRQIRVALGLSQPKLALLLGVSKSLIVRAEAGGGAGVRPWFTAAMFQVWQLAATDPQRRALVPAIPPEDVEDVRGKGAAA